jgi:C1A family cysteine protease
MRANIARNGYSYTVGHTWVYDLPAEVKARMHGRHRGRVPIQTFEDIGPLVNHLGKALPAAFDWRNYNGHSYIGPIKNQGDCGSCYAFGAAAAAEGTYNFAAGLYDGACADFSEAFIAWCLGNLPQYTDYFHGCDGSDDSYVELQALADVGICYESAFPYSEADPQSCPPAAQTAPRVKFQSWHMIPGLDIGAIKTAIMTYGVVDTGVQTTDEFDAYTGGVYEDPNNSCPGDLDHAVSLVGWDDNPPGGGEGCWILRNSAGPEWGEGGYMWIRYTSARVACAAAYFVYSGGPPQGPPLDLKPSRNSFSSTDRIDVSADVQALSTPFFPFVRFVLPGGQVLYYTAGRGLSPEPSSYLEGGPFVLASPVSGYPVLSLPFSGVARGTYYLEGGAVDTGLNYLGSVDRETLTVR